jgi:hypothetical protein
MEVHSHRAGSVAEQGMRIAKNKIRNASGGF